MLATWKKYIIAFIKSPNYVCVFIKNVETNYFKNYFLF